MGKKNRNFVRFGNIQSWKMNRIWSPWRSQYIEQFNDEKQADNCFICHAIQEDRQDKELLVIARRKRCIALMNKYPYNSGHILIAPLVHSSEFDALPVDTLSEIMQLTQKIIAIHKQNMKPHGFNIGVNIGLSAGAGLPEHVHFHVVPRWNGDSNFMATLADIKIISSDMAKTRDIFAELLAE